MTTVVHTQFPEDEATHTGFFINPRPGGITEGFPFQSFLAGDERDDIVIGDDRDDLAVGGGGDDRIDVGGGDDEVRGENGDDFVFGRAGDDLLLGGGGNDRLIGGEGDDILKGGAGDDILQVDEFAGGSGQNRLFGQDGNDSLRGGSGFDRLNGGEGDDRLDGGGGLDLLFGGEGADTFVFTPFFPSQLEALQRQTSGVDVVQDFEAGVDKIDLATSRITEFDALKTLMTDTSYGMQIDFGDGAILKLKGVKIDDLDADDFILDDDFSVQGQLILGAGGFNLIGDDAVDDDLVGGVFSDNISGRGGDDNIFGGASSDFLSGGAGDDRLDGGAGNDVLTAGGGVDTLIGGAGADTFIFGGANGVVIVEDFDVAEDVLHLSASGIADFAAFQAAAINASFGVQLTLAGGQTLILAGVAKSDIGVEDVSFFNTEFGLVPIQIGPENF